MEIRARDKYLCQACIRQLPGTVTQYNYMDLSVHHIVPLQEDWDRRFDNKNLVTLCGLHHEMAERGGITREMLFKIAKEQEKASPPGGNDTLKN